MKQDVVPDPRNANRGTDRSRRAFANSLADYGAGRSIVTDRHGVVLAGNKTLEAAKRLNWPVEVVQTTGDRLVIVQRTDLNATDGRARQLALADNRVAELDLAWDPEVLKQFAAELDRVHS